MSSHTRTGTARRHGWGARGSGGLVARARALALSLLLVLSQVLGLFGSALGPEAAYASSPQTQTESLNDLYNPDGSKYLSDVVGVTREQVVAELEAHEHDSYYLGTPYKGLQSTSLGGTGGRPHPNGSGLSPVGMQCSGFVAYVLAAAGGDPYGTLAYGSDGWWSLRAWHHVAVANDVVCYTFDSKEELLASGLAQKGDIVVAYATDSEISAGHDQYGNAMDAHTGFFWGDTPSEDLMWQSIHPSNGFGTIVSGNQISPIQGKVYPCVYALYPMGPTKRLYDPIRFRVQKVDSQGAQVSDWDAQGNATTEGAQFTIRFYEGVAADSLDQLPSSPTRTWVIQTKNIAGHVRAWLDDQFKVSGDDWYYDNNGAISLPVGSFTVQETKAPEGYVMSDPSVHLGQIKAGTDGYAVIDRIGNWTDLYDQEDAGAGLAVADDVVRGGVRFSKVDAERDAAVPQGDATLAGAEITIMNDSANAVEVGGTWYQPGEDVMTLTTGEDGTAQTATDALPYGSYTARETKASRGYLLNSGWSKTFSVTDQGAVVDCTDSPLEEQAIRGDLSAVKADEDSMERMAGLPFLITSETTGEWHVIVTDENGMLDTSASWNPHTQATNASDAAYDPATGRVDDSKLDSSAGVWFSGHADGATPVDDSLGALPYDTYSVQELRSEANEGHNLAHFSVTVTRHGVDLHMGTVDDSTVAIGTTLTDAEGEKCVPASASTRLVDEVSYQGLTPGATYTLEGELHLVNPDGTDGGVVATASTDFKAGTKIGTTEQAFDVDTTQLGGRSLVAFETVRDASGQEVASHADLSDEGQTVTVPAIHTTLQGDAGHESAATGHVTLTDTVEYSGLTPGKSYTATGTLHYVLADGTDGGAVKDADGADVTATATFVPDSADGSAEVTFDFDAPDLAGKTVVAFEDVSHGGITYATHADVTDEGQTVRFPAIRTTATADATGDHELPAASGQKVTDTVHMENLTPGKEYALTGTLHVVGADGTDGGTLKDADGADVTATTTFTAEAATQDVTVAFDVDASGLAGSEVVAFEELSASGTTVATHADIADEGQTLRVPAIHTTATDQAGMHEHQLTDADRQMAITDTVSYEGLTPGTEYVATGTIHLVNPDGTDGGALKDADGDDVTAFTTFTPDAADGTVDVEFAFDASKLAGKTVVAFEDVSRGGVTVATHADVTDEGQSVHFVDIHTTATDKAGMHEHQVTDADSAMVINDAIDYTNLVPGREYTVTGTLHLVGEDGTDGGALTDADGDDVTASTTFTPEASDGTVDVAFALDASQLSGKTVVAFEDLSRAGVTVATHADVTDEGQSVHFVDLHTTATDQADGDHEIAASAGQTVVDRVEYTNLVPGKEYVVTGALHLVNEDGTDGGVVANATKTFTPDSADGYVDVTFQVDASKLAGSKLVAFETLSVDGTKVAAHEDLTDEGQTVTVESPEGGTPSGGSSSYPNTGQGPVAAALIAAGLTAVGAAGIRGARRRRKTGDDEAEPEAK